MIRTTSTTGSVSLPAEGVGNTGLRAGVLGPVETLAQSVSAMAPSTSASLTIPLIFALAGNATWFVYLLATGSMLLIGFCVSRFARLSASPGSLYTYTAPRWPAERFTTQPCFPSSFFIGRPCRSRRSPQSA